MLSKILYILAIIVFSASSVQATTQVRWYAVSKALNEAGNSLNLGDNLDKIYLEGGWTCYISPTSKQMPLFEARQVTCQNENKTFEFSVQCDSNRKKDDTQIRFKDVSERNIDFIEVGCEIME